MNKENASKQKAELEEESANVLKGARWSVPQLLGSALVNPSQPKLTGEGVARGHEPISIVYNTRLQSHLAHEVW